MWLYKNKPIFIVINPSINIEIIDINDENINYSLLLDSIFENPALVKYTDAQWKHSIYY